MQTETVELPALEVATSSPRALSNIFRRLRQTPFVAANAILLLTLVIAATLAPWIAPQNPFDLASIDLMDSLNPPSGFGANPLGADEQGRDLLSVILYGTRSSLIVSLSAVMLAMLIGVGLGLLAGYSGGIVDALLMRAADVQLSFPAMFSALLLTGVLSTLFDARSLEVFRPYIVVCAIGLSLWPQFARTVRAGTMVERGKDYVLAAQIIGVSQRRILLTHILPNVLGPVIVIATLNLGQAIMAEATLSFLGVGFPATYPTLGTMVRIGNDMLFSGVWWITVFSGLALAAMVLCINVLGEWLQDVLNPRLA